MKIKKLLSNIGQFLILMAVYLLIAIQFLVGWIDRFIIAFCPWIEVKSITSAEYYDHYFADSTFRVLMVSGLAGTAWTIYELIY